MTNWVLEASITRRHSLLDGILEPQRLRVDAQQRHHLLDGLLVVRGHREVKEPRSTLSFAFMAPFRAFSGRAQSEWGGPLMGLLAPTRPTHGGRILLEKRCND